MREGGREEGRRPLQGGGWRESGGGDKEGRERGKGEVRGTYQLLQKVSGEGERVGQNTVSR